MDGVGLQVPCRFIVINPLLLDVLKVHVVVQCEGVSPRYMLEQFDGDIDGNTV